MLLAVRLLQDAFRSGIRNVNLPVWDGECIHLILPVDPYEKTFDRVRRALRPSDSEQRPDLLVIAIRVPTVPSQSPVHLKIVPVEVKFRSGRMTDEEKEGALGQASNLGELLTEVWAKDAVTPLWDTCNTALLGQCLNLAFRIYADENVHGATTAEWTRTHERVLQDVLSKRATIEIDRAGRLLVFDEANSSLVRDLNRDGSYDTAILNREDAKVLLTDIGTLSPDARESVRLLKISLPQCQGEGSTTTGRERDRQELTPTPTEAPPLVRESKDVDEGGGPGTSPGTEKVDGLQELAGETGIDKSLVGSYDKDAPRQQSATSDGPPPHLPRAFVGWAAPTSRWSLVGKLETTGEPVALDLDHPKSIGVFGYMGSGKSYLLGALMEAALVAIPGINVLPSPLSVVIFNYRRNVSDRFEMSSLASPNQDKADWERLRDEYSSAPRSLPDVHVICLPGELNQARRREYGDLAASELLFDPETLTVEDWELLMGEPGSDALFARTIRHALGDLQSPGSITLERLEEHVLSLLGGQSRRAAEIRFKFVQKYISPTHGTRFDQVLRPGRAVIVDLRKPLFTKEDALRFFLVCANQVSRVQGQFNKIIIFDEAHEYLSDAFGEKIEARIRLMRHGGTSYIFATQDVESIPSSIRRFITTKFVFSLGTRQNVEDLVRFAPEFKNHQLLGMPPGLCLLQTDQSIGNLFETPRVVRIRPRVTQHGGATRIFSASDHEEDRSLL